MRVREYCLRRISWLARAHAHQRTRSSVGASSESRSTHGLAAEQGYRRERGGGAGVSGRAIRYCNERIYSYSAHAVQSDGGRFGGRGSGGNDGEGRGTGHGGWYGRSKERFSGVEEGCESVDWAHRDGTWRRRERAPSTIARNWGTGLSTDFAVSAHPELVTARSVITVTTTV